MGGRGLTPRSEVVNWPWEKSKCYAVDGFLADGKGVALPRSDHPSFLPLLFTSRHFSFPFYLDSTSTRLLGVFHTESRARELQWI